MAKQRWPKACRAHHGDLLVGYENDEAEQKTKLNKDTIIATFLIGRKYHAISKVKQVLGLVIGIAGKKTTR